MLVVGRPPRAVPVPIVGLVPDLAEDLTTDWVPDAVAGAGARADGPGDPAGELTVATPRGQRPVVLAPMPLRLRGHELAERVLPSVERRLAPSVFGYRNACTPYRQEWLRYQAEAERLGEGAAVELRFDVRRFFSSVPADSLAVFGGDVAAFAADVERAYGQALLPGHRWARRFANVLLSAVDSRIRAPFVRWQDDYRVFVADEAQAADVLEEATGALAGLALHLNEAKTTVGRPVPKLKRFQAVGDGWHEAVEVGHTARLKHLLRLAVGGGAAVPTDGLAGLVGRMPVLAPRACWLLAARADAAAAAELLALAASPDPWCSARSLAALAASPVTTRAAAVTAAETAAESPVAAVRALSARILHSAGRPFPPSMPHVDRMLEKFEPGELAGVVPLLRTTL